jgi:hypothetical protein
LKVASKHGVDFERLARGFGIVEVAHHHWRPGDAVFAFLARREFLRGPDEADLGEHVREGDSA